MAKSPAIVLFFLSPLVAEVLTGSSPPAEVILNPLSFLVLAGLYGSGAIVIREVTKRWEKGWPSLIVLGMAYGVAEEGLMVKSFFNPNWRDIGLLGSYGRWVGINWVWAEQLTIFHAVYSVALPILLVNLIFPDQQSQLWVSKHTLRFLIVVLALEILLGFVFFPYDPPQHQYLLAVMVVPALVLLSKQLPSQLFAARYIEVPKASIFGLTGFFGSLGFFVVFSVLPGINVRPLITMLVGMLYVASVAWLVLRMSGNGGSWALTHQLGLATGAVGLFIFNAVLQDLAKLQPKNAQGMLPLSLAFVILLTWMFYQIRRLDS